MKHALKKKVTKEQIVYDSTYVTDPERKWDDDVYGLGEGGVGNCLMGIEFQFCKMKKVLEVGCTIMWMCTELYMQTITFRMYKQQGTIIQHRELYPILR